MVKQSRGVRPRTPITFFVRPKKVIKETPPRFTAATRCPALLDWSGGCGTRTTCSDITSDLAGVVCQLSRTASSFISPRRHPLTSLRYSAAHRGRKAEDVVCASRTILFYRLRSACYAGDGKVSVKAKRKTCYRYDVVFKAG